MAYAHAPELLPWIIGGVVIITLICVPMGLMVLRTSRTAASHYLRRD